MVSEKGRFRWRRRLLLLSNFTRRGFDSTTQEEFSVKKLFQYSDNPEKKAKLQNEQLLRQWTHSFFRELRGEFHGNDNRKPCTEIETLTDNSSETKNRKEEFFWLKVHSWKLSIKWIYHRWNQ